MKGEPASKNALAEINEQENRGQVPEGSGDFVLRDPRPGVLNACAKGSGANACKDIHLRPDAGLIVVFPHWLEHFVEVHGSDTPRISIAFNAVRPVKGARPV